MEKQDFNKIYKEYKATVMAIMTIGVYDKSISEDLTNEVFMKVYNHLDSYDVEKGKFNTWLITIAKNHLKDYFRVEGKKSLLLKSIDNFTDDENEEFNASDIFVDESDAQMQIENDELAVRLQKAFETLKPTYRMVAEMFMRQGRSYKEIAEILDMPMNSVKVTLLRAKQMLQTVLEPTL